MASEHTITASPDDGSATRVERVVTVTLAGLAVAYVAGLTIAVALRFWPYDSAGHPLMIDFLVFWIAGHLALHGTPHIAYVESLLHIAEVQTVGHNVVARLPWSYPPLFLCVAAALASLPIGLAFALWNCTTFLTYTGVIAAITKRPLTALAAAACPWAIICLHIGQDGLLTASIVGGTLVLLNRRPALGGLLLGLLSFKPHLGILFPIALAFGGYWRAMIWACIGTLAWTGASSAAFGYGTLIDFFHGLASAADGYLVRDGIGWYNFQSTYALARWLGAPGAACWIFQASASIACAAGVAALWRSNASFSLKAAGLAAAIPVATPYVFVYDQCVLSVALGFVICQRRFDVLEYGAVVFSFLITFFAWSTNPTAALASIAMCAVVVRRVLLERRNRGLGTRFEAPRVHGAQACAG
jgi:hypothetical protein